MRLSACLLAYALLVTPVTAAELSAQSIEGATWHAKISPSQIDPLIVKVQVLLDRAHVSPGEIDGKLGENIQKALAAFAQIKGLAFDRTLSEPAFAALASDTDSVLSDYTVSEDDARGPFVEKIPNKLEAMRDLPSLGYTSLREKLAERFHMSEDLLRALNPGHRIEAAGESLVVVNVGKAELTEKVVRIEVDKSAQQLKAFGKGGQLLAIYPATVGSTERPAPFGTLKVLSIATNPTYRYDPKYAFKEVHSREPFEVKPGANSPVGLVWIGLGDGYGIHGTPEPSKVSKTASHGCVRLTNWNALQLAAALTKGVPVEFSGDEAQQARGDASTRTKRRR